MRFVCLFFVFLCFFPVFICFFVFFPLFSFLLNTRCVFSILQINSVGTAKLAFAFQLFFFSVLFLLYLCCCFCFLLNTRSSASGVNSPRLLSIPQINSVDSAKIAYAFRLFCFFSIFDLHPQSSLCSVVSANQLSRQWQVRICVSSVFFFVFLYFPGFSRFFRF